MVYGARKTCIQATIKMDKSASEKKDMVALRLVRVPGRLMKRVTKGCAIGLPLFGFSQLKLELC